MVSAQNPFKGPQSYREGESFFGRKKEIDDLYNLIRLNTLTLFYSRSGYGKTSVIQAGLMPALREQKDFLPVYLRLNESALKDLKLTSFTEFVIRSFEKEIEKFKDGWFIVKRSGIFNPQSLFETVLGTDLISLSNNESIEEKVIPVFIFDQFEEIFSRDFETGNVSGLLEEVGFLLNNQLPPSLSATLEDESNRGQRIRIIESLKSKNKSFRILFSFREEYIPYFESLKELPPLTYANSRYRLEPFKETTALSVVQNISEGKIPASRAQIVCSELSRKQTPLAKELSVEPFLLSLACFSAYPELIREEELQPEALKDLVKNAIDNYVNGILNSISSTTRDFIEEKLITSEGRRTPYSYVEAVRQCSKEEIDELIDVPEKRLISKQQYLDSLHIEILHDRLAASVFQKKKEKIDKTIEEARRAERKLLSRKRNRERILSWIFVILIFGIAGYSQLRKYSEKLNQQQIATQDTIRSVDSSASIAVRQIAQQRVDSVTYSDLPAFGKDVDRFLKGIVSIQVSDAKAENQLQLCTDSLKQLGFLVPKAEVVSGIKFQNMVKYFYKEDKANANRVIALCNSLYTNHFQLIPAADQSGRVRKGSIEMWVNFEPYFQQLFNPSETIRKKAYQFIIDHYREHPEWPMAMINYAMTNQGNKNGIFNTLSAFNAMDIEYLNPHRREIIDFVNNLKLTEQPKTSSQAEALKNKLGE